MLPACRVISSPSRETVSIAANRSAANWPSQRRRVWSYLRSVAARAVQAKNAALSLASWAPAGATRPTKAAARSVWQRIESRHLAVGLWPRPYELLPPSPSADAARCASALMSRIRGGRQRFRRNRARSPCILQLFEDTSSSSPSVERERGDILGSDAAVSQPSTLRERADDTSNNALQAPHLRSARPPSADCARLRASPSAPRNRPSGCDRACERRSWRHW